MARVLTESGGVWSTKEQKFFQPGAPSMHGIQPQSGEERRRGILGMLRKTGSPLVGSDLAKRLDVSRQVIVQDIALLRARGHRILATSRGYLMLDDGPRVTAALSCRHTTFEEMQDELSTIVGLGGTIMDVSVEHPVYGDLRGSLMLRTQEDIITYMTRIKTSGAEPLSLLTHGVHLHNVGAPDEATIQKITDALREKGFLTEGDGGR